MTCNKLAKFLVKDEHKKLSTTSTRFKKLVLAKELELIRNGHDHNGFGGFTAKIRLEN